MIDTPFGTPCSRGCGRLEREQIVVHEVGHALATRVLFGRSPAIDVSGPTTAHVRTGLGRSPGSAFGLQQAYPLNSLIVQMAGPVAEQDLLGCVPEDSIAAHLATWNRQVGSSIGETDEEQGLLCGSPPAGHPAVTAFVSYFKPVIEHLSEDVVNRDGSSWDPRVVEIAIGRALRATASAEPSFNKALWPAENPCWGDPPDRSGEL